MCAQGIIIYMYKSVAVFFTCGNFHQCNNGRWAMARYLFGLVLWNRWLKFYFGKRRVRKTSDLKTSITFLSNDIYLLTKYLHLFYILLLLVKRDFCPRRIGFFLLGKVLSKFFPRKINIVNKFSRLADRTCLSAICWQKVIYWQIEEITLLTTQIWFF